MITVISNCSYFLLNNFTNIFLFGITIINIFLLINKSKLIKHGHIPPSKYTVSKNNFFYFYFTGLLCFPLKYLIKYLFIKNIRKLPFSLIKFIRNDKLRSFRECLFEINNWWYLIHLGRRFIETTFLFGYSSYSKMHILHLLLGICYYIFMTFYLSTLPPLNNRTLLLFLLIQISQFLSHLFVFQVIKIRKLRILKLKLTRKFNLEARRSLMFKFPYYFEFLLYYVLWNSFAKTELFFNLLWILSVMVSKTFNTN